MKISTRNKSPRRGLAAAFTLVEVMVGSAIVAFLFVAMYTGISGCFGIIVSARENLRATQIMLDRMEEFRLYAYSWVTNSGNFPTNWSEPYYPTNHNYAVSDVNTLATNINNDTGGFLYYGTLNIVPTTFADISYNSDLLMVTVTLRWTNGAPRFRTMSTIYSHYGMQGYLYN